MTTLVFVHGVNTRSTEAYLAELEVRDQLFVQVGLGGAGKVINSRWGDLVTTWSWNEASLPTAQDVKKDSPFALGEVVNLAPTRPASVVADFAKAAPQEAVDEIFIQMVEQALKMNRSLTDEELRDFRAAAAYLAKDDPADPQKFTAPSDALFARELQVRIESEGEQAYGLLNPMTNLVKGLADRIANAASSAALDLARGPFNDRVGRFLGDVFTYLQDDGPTRAKIREEVIGRLREGGATGETLVAVGHSMGGVILYDLLSDPTKPLSDLKLHLLVTAGSQVGVFEEMKLYRSSSDAFSAARGNRVPALANVARWFNVYDPVDALSFRCSPIFDGVEDFVFSSTTSLVDAHTAYFKRPRFFARLSERLGA